MTHDHSLETLGLIACVLSAAIVVALAGTAIWWLA